MKIPSNQVIPFLFGLIASIKFFLIFRESRVNEDLLALFPVALMYTAMFGSPQIFWLLKTRKTMERPQLKIAILVLFLFIISAVYFRFIPGMNRPSWGGEGHWEVVAAFLSEWLITIIFFIPYWYARAKKVAASA